MENQKSQYDFRINLLTNKKNKHLSEIKKCDEELEKIYATLNIDRNLDNSITIDMATQNDVLEDMYRKFSKETYLIHKSNANVLFTVNYVKHAYDAIRNDYPIVFIKNYVNKMADPNDYKLLTLSPIDQLEILDDMEDKFTPDKYLMHLANADNNLFTIEYVKNAYDEVRNDYPKSFAEYLSAIVDLHDRDKILDDLKNNLSKKDFKQYCGSNGAVFQPADNVRYIYDKFNIELPGWISEKYGDLFRK